MELKYSKAAWSNSLTSFNRTFMELKFVPSVYLPTDSLRFNRTFMELKSHRHRENSLYVMF